MSNSPSNSSVRVQELFGQVRVALQAVPPASRAPVTRLWATMRTAIRQLEAEVDRLNQQLHGTHPARPTTTDSVLDARYATDQQLWDSSSRNEASNTIESICELPASFATRLLRDKLTARPSAQGQSLGC